MMSKRFRAVLAGVCVLSAAEAFAQRGAFRGKLIDEQGNPLEGVVCQAELHGGGGRSTSVTTKKNGEFVKAGLQVGNYVVTCGKEGYRQVSLGASHGCALSASDAVLCWGSEFAGDTQVPPGFP